MVSCQGQGYVRSEQYYQTRVLYFSSFGNFQLSEIKNRPQHCMVARHTSISICQPAAKKIQQKTSIYKQGMPFLTSLPLRSSEAASTSFLLKQLGEDFRCRWLFLFFCLLLAGGGEGQAEYHRITSTERQQSQIKITPALLPVKQCVAAQYGSPCCTLPTKNVIYRSGTAPGMNDE